jgi:hypothetical protein
MSAADKVAQSLGDSLKSVAAEGWEHFKENAADLFAMLADNLQEFANTFLKEMMDFVLYTPLVAEDPIITKLFGIVRIISFSLIGLMFVWEGFKKAVSVDDIMSHAEFKKMFVRMIYAFVLAIFSLDMIDILIHFDNALITTVKNMFPVQIKNELTVNGTWAFVTVIALIIMQVVMGIKLILQYWMRIAELWLMAILGPLVFTMWINPSNAGQYSNWIRRIIVLVFTTFVWALMFCLYGAMVSLTASTGMLTAFPLLGPIATICLSLAMLMLMNKVPSMLSQYVDNSPNAVTMLKQTAGSVISTSKMPFKTARKVAGWLKPKSN